MEKVNCGCCNPPIIGSEYSKRLIGIDKTKGRFGEVAIEKCNQCGSFWLSYFWENEAVTKSGKWYRGIVDENDLDSITPENSLAYLESLPWHIYGGSFFGTNGIIGNGGIL